MEGQLNKSYFSKKLTADLLWSFGAICLMNGIIQIVIYPMLQRRLGVSGYGEMLYQLSLITIIGSGIGMAANNFRLLKQNDTSLANGDYLLCIFSLFVVFCIPVIVITHNKLSSFQQILYLTLAVFICLRVYSDVAYRITLNYRLYFLFYFVLSLGYLVGIALWPIFKSWIIVLLTGELVCVVFCVFNGKIYYPLQKKSTFWKTEKQILLLAVSYLLYNGVIQLDRIVLRNLLGTEAVSIYYVASLLGKTLALLVGPLNSVLLSYLSKMKKQVNQKAVLILSAVIIGASGAFFVIISLIAPWITRLLYPNIDCSNILILANLGQILCFAGSLVLTVLLTLVPSYWQLVSQGIYAFLFILFGRWGALHYGLNGFVMGTLCANIIRFVISVTVLYFAVKKIPKSTTNNEEESG